MSDKEPADRIEDSIAAYVLGAVGPEEEAAIRARLQSSPAARELERRLRRVVSELPLAVEQASPSPGLRTRVLNAAGATAPARARPAPRRRRWHWRPAIPWPALRWQQAWPRAATAALALMVVALAGWNVHLAQQVQTSNVLARSQLVATAPAFQGSRANVLYFRGQHLVMVDFNSLPSLPPGHVYQLWIGDGHGKVVRGDYFIPDAVGGHLAVIDRDTDGFSELTLTVEPGPRGSSQPTQPPQMIGRM